MSRPAIYQQRKAGPALERLANRPHAVTATPSELTVARRKLVGALKTLRDAIAAMDLEGDHTPKALGRLLFATHCAHDAIADASWSLSHAARVNRTFAARPAAKSADRP